MPGQDKSQQHIGKRSLIMNPHSYGFFHREMVNEITTLGTIYIAAKATDRHHFLPSPSTY